MLVVSDSYWAIIHRHLTSHWLILANIIFSPLLFIFSVLSISVDNDCSCSSGPEGKQRCKIGQLILHLRVKIAWSSFPRHLYRIYIKSPTRATSPSRSPTKFAHTHTHTHPNTKEVNGLRDASDILFTSNFVFWLLHHAITMASMRRSSYFTLLIINYIMALDSWWECSQNHQLPCKERGGGGVASY